MNNSKPNAIPDEPVLLRSIGCKHIVYTRAAMDVLRLLCHADLTTPVETLQCNLTDTTRILFRDDRRNNRLSASTILDRYGRDSLSDLKNIQHKIAMAKAIGTISAWILDEEIKKLPEKDQEFIRRKYAEAFN